MGIKNLKGTVAVSKYKNAIRLRWRYAGKRYCLSLFSYSKKKLVQAKKIALAIEDDLVTGRFDFSLTKYKYNSQLSSNASLSGLFENWASTYKNKSCNVDKKYHTVRNMLKRWDNIQPVQILERLGKEPLCGRTYNERLRMLSQFLDCLVMNGSLQVNYLKGVQPRKVDNRKRADRKPFTEQEISQILRAIKEDAFCKSHSYKHSTYYPFVYFIFYTGVRNAEAIGLRVKHIDFENGLVEIKEVLARTVQGSHPTARVRKETKNGEERKLPLDSHMIDILRPMVAYKKADNLVFLSPKGLPIDDRLFQSRVFKKVLEGLHIPYRVLYACRHTFASRCINEGLSPIMTAFLMGNNPETALRSYTHQVSLPEHLPRIAIDVKLNTPI